MECPIPGLSCRNELVENFPLQAERILFPSPHPLAATSSLGSSGEQFGPFFLHTIDVQSRSLAHSNTTWNTLFLSLSFEKHDLII